MVRACEIAANDFSGAIGQDHAAVIAEERVMERRLHAHARRPADEDEALDLPLPQNVIELRVKEPAVALLRDDNVAGLGGELRNPVGVPRPFDQEVAAADAEPEVDRVFFEEPIDDELWMALYQSEATRARAHMVSRERLRPTVEDQPARVGT